MGIEISLIINQEDDLSTLYDDAVSESNGKRKSVIPKSEQKKKRIYVVCINQLISKKILDYLEDYDLCSLLETSKFLHESELLAYETLLRKADIMWGDFLYKIYHTCWYKILDQSAEELDKVVIYPLVICDFPPSWGGTEISFFIDDENEKSRSLMTIDKNQYKQLIVRHPESFEARFINYIRSKSHHFQLPIDNSDKVKELKLIKFIDSGIDLSEDFITIDPVSTDNFVDYQFPDCRDKLYVLNKQLRKGRITKNDQEYGFPIILGNAREFIPYATQMIVDTSRGFTNMLVERISDLYGETKREIVDPKIREYKQIISLSPCIEDKNGY
jgi:hypothetical protein